MLSFEEFAAGAKQVDRIANCTVEKYGNWVRIVVESHLSNADGSVVAHGCAAVDMTPEQFDGSTPGPWLLQSFDRAIADKWNGYTRYATADEFAAYKSAKEAAPHADL